MPTLINKEGILRNLCAVNSFNFNRSVSTGYSDNLTVKNPEFPCRAGMDSYKSLFLIHETQTMKLRIKPVRGMGCNEPKRISFRRRGLNRRLFCTFFPVLP